MRTRQRWVLNRHIFRIMPLPFSIVINHFQCARATCHCSGMVSIYLLIRTGSVHSAARQATQRNNVRGLFC